MKNNFGFKLGLIGCLTLAGATLALAQEHPAAPSETPVPVQIVALDECDPATFNAALGPAFCHNVTLGAFTTLSDLFAKAAAGTPDPNWDFEPDTVNIKKGTPLLVVDQGGGGPAPGQRSFKRRTSLPVLHSPLDARKSRSEINNRGE